MTRRFHNRKLWVRLFLRAVLPGMAAAFGFGCGRELQPAYDEEGRRLVHVWVHSGQAAERETLRAQVAAFNEANPAVRVRKTVVPEGDYNARVQAAALSGDLPDLLEFDGPFLYNYVWQGHLQPIGALLSESLRQDLLPSIIEQGTFDGELYSVGVFDSGLGLYADRRRLEGVGARVPEGVADAWSVDEFDEILAALSEAAGGRPVLDLKVNYTGEWYCYAFSPVLQSAGADLIDRETYARADGVLNGPEAVAAMTRLQTWFARGYVHPNIDDAAFVQRDAALSWSGHWDYPRYAEALGEDLLLLPLPDFGEGSRTGQGSWNWGLTRRAHHPEAAVAFLEFLLRPEEVLRMTDANGAVPARREAIARSGLFREEGPLGLFVEQLENSAVPRPATPGYPVITAVFESGFQDIRDGADVQAVLDRMARRIDEDIADNQGYPRR
jgi:multiple sugar transport system substrate-binding protein